MHNKLHFISAGAGSGKTYRLTQILHAKISSGEIRPSGVIATTFTRKAATELRERVRSHLLEQGDYKFANAMGQARINTVNGVCGNLLLRFAFEAGMSTEQQVLEEAQEKILLNEAVDAVMNGEQISKLLAIVRRMGSIEWKDDLAKLIKQTRANDIDTGLLTSFAARNADELLSYFPKAAKDDITKALVQVIQNELPALELGAEAGKKNTNDYLHLVKDTLDKLLENEASWTDWAKLAAGAPEKSLLSIAERISAVANRYAEHPQLHNDVRDYLKIQFTLCEKALQAYAARKLEMGVLDFIDQELLLLRTLNNETVLASLREELDLLMVDEFQDTSPIQLALFLKLAELAKEVYWVGDIKQAIYGFRGSDSTLMKAILDSLTAMGGDKEILDKSWRSRLPLVSLVNEVFVPAFASSLKADEIRLIPERTESLPGAALANWQLNGANVAKRNSALVSGVKQLVDSAYIVHDKPAKLTRPVRYGDIAILSRKNEGVIAISAELRRQGVPSAIAQAGLMQTPEAILAIACLRRLNDPADTIASAEIVSLAGSEEPEVWVTDRLKLMANAPADKPNGYGNNWREEGENVYPLLAQLATMRTDMPILSPLEALQSVIALGQLTTVVLQWCGSSAEARTRLANLEALLAMASTYEETSHNVSQSASVSGLILWLKEQADNQEDLLALPAINAVQIMTLHSAKGLEWPVVILTDLEKKVRDRLWSITTNSQSSIDVQQPLLDRFIHFWPWPFGKMEKVTIAETIADSELSKKLSAEAVEEEKRLLYVSMTRARDLLILARGGRESEASWIKVVAADWLQGVADATELQLPSGEKIPYQDWVLDPVEDNASQPAALEPIHWFKALAAANAETMPLKFTPSAIAQQSCTITNSIEVGQRLTIQKNVDMAQLGTALHACIGAAFTDANAPLSEMEVDGILQRMGVINALDSRELLEQIAAFKAWIRSQWPQAIAYAEMPVQMKMPNGQILQGRIDLLLKINNGWILIDHKSNPGGSNRWEAVAQENFGQLAAYKSAVEQASGENVLETWLFLPISAVALQLT